MCHYGFLRHLEMTLRSFIGISASFTVTVIMSSAMIGQHYSGVKMWKRAGWKWWQVPQIVLKKPPRKIILFSDNDMLDTLIKRALFAVAFISRTTNNLRQAVRLLPSFKLAKSFSEEIIRSEVNSLFCFSAVRCWFNSAGNHCLMNPHYSIYMRWRASVSPGSCPHYYLDGSHFWEKLFWEFGHPAYSKQSRFSIWTLSWCLTWMPSRAALHIHQKHYD